MAAFFLAVCSLPAATLSTMGTYTLNGRDYVDYSYDFRDDGVLDYVSGRLYVPEGYNPADTTKTYPLVVYFHGNGQGSGSPADYLRALKGTDSNLRAAAEREDFFLFIPQATIQNAGWGYPGGTYMERAMLQVGNLQSDYHIDRERLYLTGFSMGGNAVYSLLGVHSGAIAAVVPVAPNAGGIADVNAQALAGKPIWAFHNRADTLLGNAQPRNRINQIRTQTGETPWTFSSTGDNFYEENGLRYTENASEGGHAAGWVYRQGAVYDWLLAQENTTGWLQKSETIRFDFGSRQVAVTSLVDSYSGDPRYTGLRPDSHGIHWNSTANDFSKTTGTAVAFAKTTEGRSTFVNLLVETAFTEHNKTSNPQTLFDADIGQDAWITAVGQSGEIALEGLTPGALYDLEIFASTDLTSAAYRYTLYEIGSESRWLEVGGNLDKTVAFHRIAADPEGRIELGVRGTMGSTYGLIGTLSLSLSPIPEPAALALASPALLFLFCRRKRRNFPGQSGGAGDKH